MALTEELFGETHPNALAPFGVWRRIASVLIAGLGMLFLVPPIYYTIADWRGWHNELAWTHIYDMLPCCLVPAVLCFYFARRTRRVR
jgi:hypothetical protein